jgi:hypothetical protein
MVLGHEKTKSREVGKISNQQDGQNMLEICTISCVWHVLEALTCLEHLQLLLGGKTTIPKASQQPPQFKFMNPNSEVCNSKPNTLLESVTKINPHPGHISFDQTIRCPQCLDIKVVQVIQEATLKPTAGCNGVYTIATIPSSDHCKSGLYSFLPVVPHKAVAEVSKIGNL